MPDGIHIDIKIVDADGGYIKYVKVKDMNGNFIDKFDCFTIEEFNDVISKSIPDSMKQPFRPLPRSSPRR